MHTLHTPTDAACILLGAIGGLLGATWLAGTQNVHLNVAAACTQLAFTGTVAVEDNDHG